jgi:PEGA domain
MGSKGLPLAALLAVLTLFGPSLVHAQAPTGTSAADGLIEHGVELREQGHDDQALTLFRKAFAMSPSPRALAQMGLAEQALGQWGVAEQHLADALANANDPWVSSRKAVLTSAAAAIARHLGSLVVTGPGVTGGRVLLDGVDVGPLPLLAPARVEVGQRLLEVRAPGYYPLARTVEITPGATARENAPLVPMIGPPPSPMPAGPFAPLPSAPPLQDEGVRTPGAFRVSLSPAPGIWSLRDGADKTLCTLPCSYWLDPTKRYSVARVSLGSGDVLRLPLPVAGATDGAQVSVKVHPPTGTRWAGIGLVIGGAAVTAGGVALVLTAPSGTTEYGIYTPSATGVLEETYGVIIAVVGGASVVTGIVLEALSDGWRLDMRAEGVVGNGGKVKRVRLGERGAMVEVGAVTGWVGPLGVGGTF